ncbi:heterokaryon incompatibility protein-domain-containing protein [Phaeosphaeria sp. MPI-PUGE-AT-0046c]|nr:heterokaryon incompatibility protein-domain-containing protein [Phaeosphaeria sp. MPI-PUGE-AT-0046c]
MAAITTGVDKDPDTLTVPASHSEPIPDGCVPLHQLCDECRSFFDNWEILDEFERYGMLEPTNVYDTDVKPFRAVYQAHAFRNIAQILVPHELCHFCTIMSGKAPAEFKVWNGHHFRSGAGLENSEVLFECSRTYRAHVQLYIYSNGIRWRNNLSIFKIPSTRERQRDCLGTEVGAFGPPTSNHVPRRAIDNLEQIKRWMQGCRSNHTHCHSLNSKLGPQYSKRPTRIVEILPKGIRLRCDVETIVDFEYLTLSHVWGKNPSQQLRLSHARLDEFKAKIPLDEMPVNFKEAVRITRKTGFKYLWIDSLCILQDSKSDWEAEASKMTTVYANAFCTIAFLNEPDVGFDWPREDPRITSPCIVRRNDRTNHDICIGSFLTASSDEGEWYSRAWTFQEYLLSPRTIFYGRENSKWECREVFADELLGTAYNFAFRSIGKSHLSISPPPRMHTNPAWVPAHLNAWRDLVQNYRARRLTVPSDRIMAFAGVAEAFSLTHGLTYVAGAWAESLTYCMLWRSDYPTNFCTDQSKEQYCSRTTPPVPSWSWFKQSINVCPKLIFIPDSMLGVPKDVIVLRAELVHYQHHGLGVNEASQNQYYDFTNLSITLRLATCPVTLQSPDTDLNPSWKTTGWWFAAGSNLHRSGLHHFIKELQNAYGDASTVQAQYFCDDVADVVKDTAHVTFALLLEVRQESVSRRSSLQGTVYSLVGLALRPSGKDGTWRRVGLWLAHVVIRTETSVRELAACKDTIHPEPRSLDVELSDKDRASCFLRCEGAKMETLTLV